MKLYLAAKYSTIADVRAYAEELKSDGHEIVSTWVFDAEDGMDLSAVAVVDMDDVKRAEGIMCFTHDYASSHQGGGHHSEFGMGLIIDKLCMIVGPREQVFHWHPKVIHFPQFWHARRYLKSKLPIAA